MQTISALLSKQFRDIYYGGNWTGSNMKDVLKDISWKQSIEKFQNLNTIATLTFHSTYYVSVFLKVLEGGSLDGKDEYSFNLPPVNSQLDWENLLKKIWEEAEKAADLIEQ